MEKIEATKNRKFLSEIYSSTRPEELLACIGKEKSVFAVVDDRAYRHSPQIKELAAALEKNRIPVKRLETSESLKSFEGVLEICSWLLEHNADRTSLVLGIGGGILTDMAGFAASIYMRGIRYANVPTTLLAQVDAAVGGKTGVNFKGYKNMLGVIRQPEFTFISSAFLKSLPRREFFSGAAELLKTFMINNENGAYGRTVLVLSCIAPARDQEIFQSKVAGYEQELVKLVAEAVRVKMEIVTVDPFEQGERRKLNLGHTFAHAIEHCAAAETAPVDISHGEAVAMGLVLAAGMSEKQGFAREGFGDQVRRDLETCGLVTDCPFEKMALMEAMRHDKKSAGKNVNFVLMRNVGEVVITPVKLPSK